MRRSELLFASKHAGSSLPPEPAQLEDWLTYQNLLPFPSDLKHSYTHALQALSHAMVLAPQNPFYVLQFAQTASINEEIALALKMYLRTAEMIESDEDDGFLHDANEVARQAWLGVKTVSPSASWR